VSPSSASLVQMHVQKLLLVLEHGAPRVLFLAASLVVGAAGARAATAGAAGAIGRGGQTHRELTCLGSGTVECVVRWRFWKLKRRVEDERLETALTVHSDCRYVEYTGAKGQ